MKRKKALQIAIDILKKQSHITLELQDATRVLEEMMNGVPSKIWGDKEIREAIERFISERGRPPLVKELSQYKYLPPHPVFKHQYKMTAGRWLYLNYPPKDPKWNRQYKTYTKKDYEQMFIEEYKRILPTSCLDYNHRRNKQFPTWRVVAKEVGVDTWTQLKKHCCVDNIPLYPNKEPLVVVSHIQFKEKSQK